jgi:DNA helicase II / ATP-dependent DNA helicase PcrA
VIAGAGSGKTKVIAYRVLQLIEKGVEPSSILLLTFTRKAAREMLARAERHHHRCREVHGGTFHGTAARLLREHGAVMGVDPHFTIWDSSDAQQMIERCTARHSRDHRLPPAKALQHIFSLSISRQVSLSEVLRDSFPAYTPKAQYVEQVQSDYQAIKRTANAMDFDDLLLGPSPAAAGAPPGRRAARRSVPG